MHHVETHNGPVVHTGGYLHVQGAAFNPVETVQPKLGTGIEMFYVRDEPVPSAANGYGVLQAYSRETMTYRDLVISGKDVRIQNPGGGRTILPAGTAQALVGNWYTASGWVIPSANQWYESEVRANYTIASSPLVRFEFCLTLNTTIAGTVIYVGLGIDGVLTWASICVTGFPTAGLPQVVSGFMYHQGHPLGIHRASIWLYTSGGGRFDAGASSGLWITEQRA